MHGSKPRVWMTGQAQGLHAPPAIVGRRLPAGITQRVMPTDKRFLRLQNRDFDVPTTRFRWRGKEHARLCAMPRH